MPTVRWLLLTLLAPSYAQTVPFTAAQSDAGLPPYQTHCATCHLAGRYEAPQLAGANLLTAWSRRSTRDLCVNRRSTMPPSSPAGRGYTNSAGPFVVHGKVIQSLTGCSSSNPPGSSTRSPAKAPSPISSAPAATPGPPAATTPNPTPPPEPSPRPNPGSASAAAPFARNPSTGQLR